jgi:hypothetical protein
MTDTDIDAQRIRDAFEHDLSGLYAAPGLADRARRDGLRAVKRRRVRRVACVATAACAASVAVAVTAPWAGPAARSPGPGSSAVTPPVTGPVSAAGKPTAASVSKAMLTSFDALGGDILYEKSVLISASGQEADYYQDWFWPALPVQGQQVRQRELDTQADTKTGQPMPLFEDWSAAYAMPPAPTKANPFATPVSILLTMVCRSFSGGCGYGPTETPSGTWSRTTIHQVPEISDITPGAGMYNPADLAREIAQGQWQVMGATRLDGQEAIELRETAKGTISPLQYLWVSAQTHLPLFSKDSHGDEEYISYLPPTPANLAHLRVPIPAGYSRSDARRR